MTNDKMTNDKTDILELLKTTVEKGASDLHLTAGSPPMVRIFGDLTPVGRKKLSPEDTREMAMSILSAKQKEVFEQNRSIDLAYSLDGACRQAGRFRVNAFYQRGRVSVAFRRLSDEFLTLEELCLPSTLYNLAQLRDGLVLVTGPTGSGKTTTLASLLDMINQTRPCHIITIEDPIEYVHEHKKAIVNQRELYSDVASFGEALRYAVREDPDVILVGEMRDLDTMRTAIMAAETGHLVFSTLHSRDAVSTINRAIGVFPIDEQQLIRQQLSMTLKAVVSQRLLRRSDTPGLVPAVEVMIVTSAISNLIRTGKDEQIYSAIETGGVLGMQTMEESLCTLCRAGKIAREAALKTAKSVRLVEHRLR